MSVDGQVYDCCGKVGRISAHYPWCQPTMPDPTPPVLPAALEAATGAISVHSYRPMSPGEAATLARIALTAAGPILRADGRREAAEALHILPGSDVWRLVTGEGGEPRG